MATAATIRLDTNVQPAFYRKELGAASAEMASKLLQVNHEQHHIYFNQDGFHNHIVHHLLALFALKASPEQIKIAYENNKGYQRSSMGLDQDLLARLSDPETFIKHLGVEKYYPTYLEFFHKEIDRLGWQQVVQQYVFSGTEVAETMLVRNFGGYLHPIIHLGYGVEFQEPAIIAEALAQAAIHADYLKKFFYPAEEASKRNSGQSSKSIVELLDAVHDDPALRESAKWSDGNKLRDGVIARAGHRAVEFASQFHVDASELEQKTAEMVNAVCWYSAAAQRPGKKIKWDFFYMHCVNSSIFWSAFLKQDWLSENNKVRLLQWKVWSDLAMYASRKCPDMYFEDVRQYQPKQPSGWDQVIDRVIKYPDDGHASKLVRALAHGQQICQPFQHRAEFRVKEADWLLMAHTVVDSLENLGKGEERWIRSTGFDEAWENEPARL